MGNPRRSSIRNSTAGGIAGLVVQADDDEAVRYGKSVADLQENVVINGNGTINGTLKYVTGYTGYSSDPATQSGNYLAITVDADDGATITASLNTGGSVDLTEDKYLVLRVANKDTQILTITATKSGKTETKVYRLNELVCETA